MGQAKNLIQQIQRGKISPVYLLHGEETYLIEETLEDMIDLLVPKNVRDFNLDLFSDPTVSATEILSMANTYPVMAERRVVVVKDPGFFSPKKKIDHVDILRQSREQHRLGNIAKAAALFVRALNIEPEELAEMGSSLSKAVNTFKKSNESELESDDLEFLANAIDDLAAEIDTSSTSSASSELEQLLEYLADGPASTTVLIFTVSSTLRSNSKIAKAFSKVGTTANFGQLRQSRYVNRDPMYQMVMDKLRECKKSIAPDAFSELQKKTGNNMRQIFDELDKLVTFVGERQRIEKSDIEELVTKTSSDRIFDLTNAIGQKSLPLALANLESILENGDHPLLIHNMLTRQIRFLLQAKIALESGSLKPEVARMSYDAFQNRVYKKLSPELIGKFPDSAKFNFLKQHQYPLHLTIQQARNFTIQELISAMERLLEADIQLKSGHLTPELVIEMLVMDLISNA